MDHTQPEMTNQSSSQEVFRGLPEAEITEKKERILRRLEELTGEGGVALQWTRILERFTEAYRKSFVKSKKCHFDCLPEEWGSEDKVVDGARSKWSAILLLDAILGFLTTDHFDLSVRRSFNQHKILYDSILCELKEVDEELWSDVLALKALRSNNSHTLMSYHAPASYWNKFSVLQVHNEAVDMEREYVWGQRVSAVQVTMINDPWDSILSLRDNLLEITTSKSKKKYIKIIEGLTTHPVLQQLKSDMEQVLKIVAVKALFVFSNYFNPKATLPQIKDCAIQTRVKTRKRKIHVIAEDEEEDEEENSKEARYMVNSEDEDDATQATSLTTYTTNNAKKPSARNIKSIKAEHSPSYELQRRKGRPKKTSWQTKRSKLIRSTMNITPSPRHNTSSSSSLHLDLHLDLSDTTTPCTTPSPTTININHSPRINKAKSNMAMKHSNSPRAKAKHTPASQINFKPILEGYPGSMDSELDSWDSYMNHMQVTPFEALTQVKSEEEDQELAIIYSTPHPTPKQPFPIHSLYTKPTTTIHNQHNQTNNTIVMMLHSNNTNNSALPSPPSQHNHSINQLATALSHSSIHPRDTSCNTNNTPPPSTNTTTTTTTTQSTTTIPTPTTPSNHTFKPIQHSNNNNISCDSATTLESRYSSQSTVSYQCGDLDLDLWHRLDNRHKQPANNNNTENNNIQQLPLPMPLDSSALHTPPHEPVLHLVWPANTSIEHLTREEYWMQQEYALRRAAKYYTDRNPYLQLTAAKPSATSIHKK